MDNKNVVMVNYTVFSSVIGVVALGGMIAACYSQKDWVAWLFVAVAALDLSLYGAFCLTRKY